MTSILFYVFLIVAALLARQRYKDPWIYQFVALVTFLLVLSIWSFVSDNYLEISQENRVTEAIIVIALRILAIAGLIVLFVKDWMVPKLKNSVDL